MTIFHHVLSRLALVFFAFWGGGGLILLSYCALRWEKRAGVPLTGPRTHVAGALFLKGEPTAAPRRFSVSDFSMLALRQPELPARTLRSTSALQLDHPPETGLVSAVIPTHNRAQIIGRALESALAQTHGDIQVIVADDGSSDDTRTVAESYGARVTYVRQANAGVSAARNFGMRHARGEFIAFLDSDDSWEPWKIEAQVAALRRHPEAGLVWTDMAAVDDSDRLINARHLRAMYAAYEKVDIERTLRQVDTLGGLSPGAPRAFSSAAVREGDLFGGILLGNLIHTSTVLFRRSWCEQTGGFDESFARAGEDYEFYIRLCSRGPVVFIDAPSTVYRIGAVDQLTAPSMMLEIARNNLRAIQKWIPRSAARIGLPRKVVRRRFAESFAWVGEEELGAGHRWNAVRSLTESLAIMPGLDRRAILLGSCVLPHKVLDGLRSARRGILARSGSRADRPA
jgi:glycosyltransferase involved in cell wall biosynthesis